MAASRFFFLLVAALLHGHGRSDTNSDEWFISIDCGLPSGSRYVDEKTNITYVSDDGYIDTGENHNISSEYQGAEQFKSGLNLRSFPAGGRNCYTFSAVVKDQKYLIRGMFMYGNYDDKSQNLFSSPLIFDIYVGLDFWSKVSISNATMTYMYEAIVVAMMNSISVCLIDNGKGTPFISSLEMRPMKSSLYPGAMPNQPLLLHYRRNMGASSLLRYPDDPYDRLWWPSQNTSGWFNISTTSTVRRYTDDVFEVPIAVLQTASTSSSTSQALNFSWEAPTGWAVVPGYFLNVHLTDFQDKFLRVFHMYYNDEVWDFPRDKPTKPPYLMANYINNTDPYTSSSGLYNISFVATNTSVLPPMLNAVEIYYRVKQDDKKTSLENAIAMEAIKYEYQVKKNWMGDPCLPEIYKWIGLKCKSDGVTSKIISLDLSHSDLHGAISEQFSLLESVQYLNLSYNSLNGSVPESLTKLSALRVLDLSRNNLIGIIPEALCTKKEFTLRYDTMNGDPCNRSSKKRTKNVLAIGIVAPVVIFLMILLAISTFCFCRKKGNPKSRSHEECKDQMQTSDDREFTYEELLKITDNFSSCIGEGGFGPVFHGRLKDGTEVAVKMRSHVSSLGKGMPEFFAEVESLTTVHHRYLVLLVGCCSDKDHVGLVYEYLPNGSLYDHLRGKKAIAQTLSWQHRARIALEAALGLEYLHTGCVLPIVHRDVKSHNIFLGRDLKAKISDFGLSKSYLNIAQSHISVAAAGTLGYIDPEYCRSSRLTMSSDVYSFGVVLLEIVTGEPPIESTSTHIVQRVREKANMGDIEMIVDPRLDGDYDVSSVWKVVDIALLCTKDASDERPTMGTVVAQLKESLALEAARASDSNITDISYGGANPVLSIDSMPSAR